MNPCRLLLLGHHCNCVKAGNHSNVSTKAGGQVLAGLLQFISATAPGTSHTTRSSSAPQCDDDGDVVAAWEAASAVQEARWWWCLVWFAGYYWAGT